MTNHLSAPQLVDFHYGGLDDPAAAPIRNHLNTCESCRAFSVALEREREALKEATIGSTKAQARAEAPVTRLRVAWRRLRTPAIKVAAILVALGVGFSLYSSTSSRFRHLQEEADARNRAWAEQIDQMKKTADAQSRALGQTQIEWRAGMKKAQEEHAQDLALLQTDFIRQKERIARSIALVQENLEREVSRLKMLQSDSTQRNDERRLSLEKEFGQEKEKLQDSLKTRQQELEELTKRLEELKERAEASEKRLPEIGTAKVLSLGSDDAVSLSWEPPNKSPYAPLTLRGSSVGWAVQSGLVGEGTSPYSGVAAINGRVFVGNGFTQNKLAAYNPSGKLLWEHVMNDPGAGTPVLSEDGETVYVASESCTLYAIATASGTRRWSRVVGPTALTQPSVARNRVLVVARTQDSARANGLPYSLSAINAQDGNFAWIQGLQTDALSAPVIEGGKTYVATRDGMLTVFDIGNGKLLGSHNLRATSAPWVTGNSLLFTSWSSSSKSGFEESFGSLAADGSTKTQQLAGPFPATYLLPSTPDARPDVADGPSPTPTSTPSEPEERALKQALTRSAAQPAFSHEWSYMGARPTVIGEDAYLAVGDQVMNWDLRQGRAKWGLKVTSRTDNLLGLGQGQPPLTPPAYAGGKLYFASVCGDVICMDAASGIVLWRLRLPGSQGIVSQPVLDRGNLYVTTKKGLLVSIDARDPQATGWSVWGGGPGHNGPVTPPPPQKKR